jgi:hypothetical protein
MIRGVTYSDRLLALCIAAVGAVCAMAWLRQHLEGDWLEQRRRAADLEGVLSRQVTAMSDCDDSHLNALRALVDRFRGQLGTEDPWGRLVLLFGKDWTAEPGPRDQGAGYLTQIGTFVMLAPSVSDWPGIVDAVRSAEQLPGVGIAGLEMRSTGDRDHRSLETVKIVVAIRSRLSGSAP